MFKKGVKLLILHPKKKTMNLYPYLPDFEKAAYQLDPAILAGKNLRVEVGVWMDSAVLRLCKNTWANKPHEKPQTDAAIFFSIWANEQTVKQGRLYYNIHALKLRLLKGYKLTSKPFAAAFRAEFKRFEHDWPNVSVDFGPLTLMEGWVTFNEATLQEDICRLTVKFCEIDSLIDGLLAEFKKEPSAPRT